MMKLTEMLLFLHCGEIKAKCNGLSLFPSSFLMCVFASGSIFPLECTKRHGHRHSMQQLCTGILQDSLGMDAPWLTGMFHNSLACSMIHWWCSMILGMVHDSLGCSKIHWGCSEIHWGCSMLYWGCSMIHWGCSMILGMVHKSLGWSMVLGMLNDSLGCSTIHLGNLWFTGIVHVSLGMVHVSLRWSMIHWDGPWFT